MRPKTVTATPRATSYIRINPRNSRIDCPRSVGSSTTPTFHIAHKLGVKGAANRAKLPACFREKIAEMYPDTEGEATKVGYKQ